MFEQKFSLKAGIFTLFLAGIIFQSSGQNYDDAYMSQTKKMNQLLQMFKLYYVDTVHFTKLVEKGTVEMLKELDPHSVYIPKEDVARTNEPLQGNFEGVGIQFQIMKDTVVVIQPVKGGPAEKVGILAGDKIIQIDDSVAVGKICTNSWIFGKLRGKKDTKVNVRIKRGNNPEPYSFTIIRDKIPINSIESYFMIDKVNGYIKLERFSQTSTQEFISALRELKNQGMKNLMLDLRGNSGGFLNVAVDLVNEFLPANKLVVYTQNNQYKTKNTHYTSFKQGLFEEGKLVVLIDEYSASASEIVSGAIQDWDRGIIVGRRSFGKGLVQQQLMLADSSQMRLTTSRYYIPSGRCIQKPYEGVEDYNRDLIKRYNAGELSNADSIHFPDSLKYYTEKGRTVYGGGGIMPDVFIPMDTVKASDYYWKLLRNNIFSQFVVQYLEANKEDILREHPTFDQFNNGYKIDAPTWDLFYDFAKQEGISDSTSFNFKDYLNGFLTKNKDTLNKLFPSFESVQENDAFEQMLNSYIKKEMENQLVIRQNFDTKSYIERQIRFLIARNLYDNNKSAKIWLELDDAYLRALEVLNNTNLFKKLGITY